MNVNVEVISHNTRSNYTVSSQLLDVLHKIISETYLGLETIYVENPTNVPCGEISDFLTFILAYPANVDTPKVIVSERTSDVASNTVALFEGRTIVCYSGGIDSTGALLKALDEKKSPVALWCDYGQPYREPERQTVEKICQQLGIPLIEAKYDLSSYIEIGGVRFGHVFPARNLMIASICLCFFPSEIILAGLCDELAVPDKSIRMYNEFGHYFGTRLYSPFVNMTKTDVLCLWKKRWNKYLDARETVSCYGQFGNCQNCSSCAKREIALTGSGYTDEFPPVFINQSDLITHHWFSRMDLFQYERRTDILISLNKFRGKLRPELSLLVNQYCAKYSDEIDNRKKELEKLYSVS